MTATEVLRRCLAAKLGVFVAVLAVLVLLALVDPAYEVAEKL